MKKGIKTALITAAVFIALGIVICAAGFLAIDFKFSALSNEKITIDTFNIDDSFESIKFNTDVCSIRIEPSEDGVCRVEARKIEQLSYNYDVQNNTLVISEVDNREWYDYIGISFEKSEIALFLPESEYNALSFESDTGDITVCRQINFKQINIDTDTGDAKLDGIKCDAITAYTNTGDIDIENTNCNSFTANTDTGDLDMKNFIVADNIKINTNTGDVTFSDCDAKTLLIETDTGDVEGTLLSQKIFVTETDTGNINVPKSTKGGKCEITTDTGDIKIDIK